MKLSNIRLKDLEVGDQVSLILGDNGGVPLKYREGLRINVKIVFKDSTIERTKMLIEFLDDFLLGCGHSGHSPVFYSKANNYWWIYEYEDDYDSVFKILRVYTELNIEESDLVGLLL